MADDVTDRPPVREPNFAPIVAGDFKVSEFGWNGETDTFYVVLNDSKGRLAINTPLDDLAWARYDVETGEVLGFEIEGFVAAYISAHPKFAEVWTSIEPVAQRATSMSVRPRPDASPISAGLVAELAGAR